MAIDAFLQLYKGAGKDDAVSGECMDSVFRGAIQLSEFSLDALSRIETDEEFRRVSETKTGPQADGPEEELTDSFSLSIEKEFDTSSTDLFLNYCWTAKKQPQTFKKGIVSLFLGSRQWKKPEHAYLTLEFSDLYVVKWELSLDAKNILNEKVEFNFDGYKMTYRGQSHTDGTVSQKATIAEDHNFSKAPAKKG